jgi:hypothetical protein
MSDHFIRDEKGRCHAIITMANIYSYGGFIFEFHRYCGPFKLKKDWEPAARQGRKFYKMIDEWCKLTKEEQESTRLAG